MDTGTRVIELHPEREASQRWEGAVQGDTEARRWPGRDPETVVGAMDADLGRVPESSYVVREGGAA